MPRKRSKIVRWKKGMSLKDLEKEVILSCLKSNEGNQTQTAYELGISVKSIYNKLKEYGCLQKY